MNSACKKRVGPVDSSQSTSLSTTRNDCSSEESSSPFDMMIHGCEVLKDLGAWPLAKSDYSGPGYINYS